MAERNAWDKIEGKGGETASSYAAFLDYRDMGKRSLRSLLARYEAQKSDETQTEKPPTAKWATLSSWSACYNWVERVAAWDQHVYVQRNAEMLRKRTRVEDDDFNDYERELEAWRRAYERTKQHERRREETVMDPTTGMPMVIITVEMTVADFERLARWRDRVSRRGRRAVGLPETITQANTDVTSGGAAITWETLMSRTQPTIPDDANSFADTDEDQDGRSQTNTDTK